MAEEKALMIVHDLPKDPKYVPLSFLSILIRSSSLGLLLFVYPRVGSPFLYWESSFSPAPFHWARPLPLGVSSAEAALRIQSYKIRSQFAYLTIRSQSQSAAVVVALNLHIRSFVFSCCSSFYRFEVIYSILFTVFDE